MASLDQLQSEIAAGIQAGKSLENSVLPVVDTVASSPGARTKALKTTKGFGAGVLGLTTALQEPRKSYNFQVGLDFGLDLGNIVANVKSIDRPRIIIDYNEQRYFNTTRKNIRRVRFEPIKMTIFDTLDNTVYNEFAKLITKLIPDSAVAGFNIGNDIYQFNTVNNTTLRSVSIYSGSSPIMSLLGSANDLLSHDLHTALQNGVVKTMTLSEVTIDKVDFGSYDYSSSEPQVITLEFSYQSLLFRESSVYDSATTVLGGIGLQEYATGV